MPARSTPTNGLRFIKRNGERILQQQWEIKDYYINSYGEGDFEYTYEWRDVKSYEDDPGPYSGGGIIHEE